MRLFTAINFDRSTKDKLIAVQERLRTIATGSFSHPENLHLTLAFLGEVEPSKVSLVKQAMDKTVGESTEIAFEHVGNFKRDGGAIWWIGLRRNDVLEQIQHNLSNQLASAGFVLEDRRFSPHITLARKIILHQEADLGNLMGTPFKTNVDSISLMKSERINGKLTYTEIYKRIFIY